MVNCVHRCSPAYSYAGVFFTCQQREYQGGKTLPGSSGSTWIWLITWVPDQDLDTGTPDLPGGCWPQAAGDWMTGGGCTTAATVSGSAAPDPARCYCCGAGPRFPPAVPDLVPAASSRYGAGCHLLNISRFPADNKNIFVINKNVVTLLK